MYVNFEFLGDEPLENIATFMHFKMDKAVFFGSSETINEQGSVIKNFLTEVCYVKEVDFVTTSDVNFDATAAVAELCVTKELNSGNDLFFDLTGGRNVILAAFGLLSDKYGVPMHMYNMKENMLLELNEKNGMISKKAPHQKANLDIDWLIRLHGGVINYDLQKDYKADHDEEFYLLVEKVWDVSRKYSKTWNSFSGFCASVFAHDHRLDVQVSNGEIEAAIKSKKTAIRKKETLIEILGDLELAGAIVNFAYDDSGFFFKYASEEIKSCICEAGSILELYVYMECSRIADSCMAGVHIDWDGVIHKAHDRDVFNEIDVLAIKDNVPIFISCKNGKMGSSQTLYAMYELGTIALRFGGKYAKKVLISSNPLPNPIYKERAAEMGMGVIVIDEIEKADSC